MYDIIDRAIIIDDKYDEAEPLISIFRKKGISWMYYTGKNDELPENPLSGIRFVFLDVELSLGATDINTMASTLAGIMNQLISPDNGPYVIFFWSKHSDDVKDKLLKYLENAQKAPVQCIDLEKSAWQSSGSQAQYISDKFQSSIMEIEAVSLYLKWEKVLRTSSDRFIHDLCNLFTIDDEWSQNTLSLFNKLYDANSYDEQIANDKEKLIAAYHLINRSFSDYLENDISTINFSDTLKLDSKQLDNTVVAKINTSLFIQINRSYNSKEGACYKIENNNLLTALKTLIFKPTQVPDDLSLVALLITPGCDMANDKMLKDADGHKIHRVIYGLLCRMDNEFFRDFKKRFNDKGKDAKFDICPFWYNSHTYMVTFHFSTISYFNTKDFSTEPQFFLQTDVLFDLQSKAANHVNRLGNSMLS